MLDKLRPQFLEKLTNILETMFFLIVEPVEDSAQDGEIGTGREEKKDCSDPSFVKGIIEFEGKTTGSIRLYLPYVMAQKMAENFLGLEEEVPVQNQILDMVGELINVVAGNLISCMGAAGEFSLTMPRAETSLPPPPRKRTNGGELDLYFQAEEGWGKLEIRLGER